MAKVIDFLRFVINYFTIIKKITEFIYYITARFEVI